MLEIRLLTVSRHGSYIRTIHDTLVLLSQCFDVALAKVEDLLTQHGTVLVAGSLLDGEMQQHHAPDEAEADQEEAQLLRGQFPQERCSHADRTGTWKSWTDFDWTGGKKKEFGKRNQEGRRGISVSVGATAAIFGGWHAARHRRDFLF